MEQFLSQLNYYLTQAWVYIPAVLSFITAIGVPSIVQLAKIFTSAKLYLAQTSVLLQKLNETLALVSNITDQLSVWCESDIAYNKYLLDSTYNKKQKSLIETHIAELETRKRAIGGLKIEKADLTSVRVVKARKATKKA